jgi:hypothetical protein
MYQAPSQRPIYDDAKGSDVAVRHLKAIMRRGRLNMGARYCKLAEPRGPNGRVAHRQLAQSQRLTRQLNLAPL